MPKKEIDLEKEWKNLREKLENKDTPITNQVGAKQRSYPKGHKYPRGTSKKDVKEGELEENVEEVEEEIDSMNFEKFVEQTPVIEERTVLLNKIKDLPVQEQPNLEDNIDSFTKPIKEEFSTPVVEPINEPRYIASENNYTTPAGFEFETSRAGIKIEAPETMMRRDFLNPMSSRSGLMPQGGGYPKVRITEEAEDNKKYFEKEY